MTIRRRITTTIDEIDDSVDRQSHTSFPTQPTERLLSDVDTGTKISSDENINDEEIESHSAYDNKNIARPTVGHTIADLVIEFKNDYRAMAVTLTVIAFIIFITKIDSIDSFKYPLLAALTFNFIWFGGTILLGLSKWIKKKRITN